MKPSMCSNLCCLEQEEMRLEDDEAQKVASNMRLSPIVAQVIFLVFTLVLATLKAILDIKQERQHKWYDLLISCWCGQQLSLLYLMFTHVRLAHTLGTGSHSRLGSNSYGLVNKVLAICYISLVLIYCDKMITFEGKPTSWWRHFILLLKPLLLLVGVIILNHLFEPRVLLDDEEFAEGSSYHAMSAVNIEMTEKS